MGNGISLALFLNHLKEAKEQHNTYRREQRGDNPVSHYMSVSTIDTTSIGSDG